MTTRAVALTEAPPSAPDQLRALALVVRYLAPSRLDPERFHRDKSEVERELRRLAGELERSPR